MKKAVLIWGVACVLCFAFFSCATLQEDVFTTASEKDYVYKSVEEYENRFIEIDAAKANGKLVSMSVIDSLLADIDTQLSDGHIEPAVGARLNAFKGLLYIIENKTKKAEEAYSTAKSLQAGDNFVQLLNIRLQKDNSKSLAACDEVLLYSSENPTILLEKGIRLYKQNRYTESVAAFDNAFMIFDREEKHIYRDSYDAMRESAWELSQSGIEISGTNMEITELLKALTKEKMVELTLSNTNFLESFTGGEKIATSSLMKKLESAGYFSSSTDQANKNNSSSVITSSTEISKTMCARFLWNLYVRETGNKKLLTAYSTRYSKLKEPVSPIGDVSLESPDFDAILGVVEKEIMNLPDGRNFYGMQTVTAVEFIGFLQNFSEKIK